MKKNSFKSRYSFFFYLSAIFFLCVSGFAIYRFIVGGLDLASLAFLLLLSFLIAYFFSFRYDCQITLDAQYLNVTYVIPFKKSVHIETSQIIEFDKQEDVVYRYHKKIFIKTFSKNYLVRYNISDNSDEKFLTGLQALVDK